MKQTQIKISMYLQMSKQSVPYLSLIYFNYYEQLQPFFENGGSKVVDLIHSIYSSQK